MSQRVILDTSTLVSAALRIDSIPYQTLLQALATCDVCASAETLAELEKALERPKFDRYLDRQCRRDFVALIHRHVHLFAIRDAHWKAVIPPCRDRQDNQFLALALAAEVGIVVSSDEDLLVMHPWHGISIVAPIQFLSEIKGSSK